MDGQVVLERDGGGWVVATQDRAPAELTFVAGILTSVKEMEVAEVVSSDSGKRGLFEVDETGVMVKLYQGGDVLEHFYIGKFGADYNSNYVRKEGEDKIYATQGIVRYEFDREDFRSLRLLFFMPDTVVKASLKYKKEDQEDVVLERRGGEWLVNNSSADQIKVGEFLQYIADLESPNVIELEEGDETGFSDPQIEIVLEFNDGNSKTLMIGDGYVQVATYYAKVVGDDIIYMLTQWQRDELIKSVDDFL